MPQIPLQFLQSDLKYELVRLIAEGGMGLVYEGLQHGVDNFRKQVAIKIIREEYSAIKDFRANYYQFICLQVINRFFRLISTSFC